MTADLPTILIAVNKTARTHPHIDKKGFYAINLMAEDQMKIAHHFSTKGDDQFKAVGHTLSKNGVSPLDGATVYLECQVQDRIEVGTHTLFIGRVIGTGASGKKPLVYHGGKYGSMEHM